MTFKAQTQDDLSPVTDDRRLKVEQTDVKTSNSLLMNENISLFMVFSVFGEENLLPAQDKPRGNLRLTA